MAQKVCVIGAGLIGSAVAAALAARGARVTVVAANVLGTDTSSGSLSWLNAADKMPLAYAEMNLNGMRMHVDYAARFSVAPWFHRGGNIRISATDAEAAHQEKIFAELGPFGYRAGWISQTELQALEPDFDVSAVAGQRIAFYPEEGWINGAPLIGRLLADARAAGAVVRVPARVVGFDLAGGRIASVRLADGGRIVADVVVNCGGPAAGRIAAEAGCHVPMTNEIGAQAYTHPAAVTLGRVIHSAQINLRPDGAGRICLHDYVTDRKLAPKAGASEIDIATSAAVWTLDPVHVEGLLDRLGTFYPATRGLSAEAVRIGLRPIPQDRRPVLGFFDACANLYSAVMHSGATQALWVGELAAREIADGKPAAELASFRPERFTRALHEA